MLFEDAPGIHEHDAVGHRAGEGHFVGDDQQGHAVPGQALDHLQHFLDHLRVQRRGDLVEQHHLRVHAQRTDDGDALLLAAGELAREGIALVQKAHPLQQRLGLGAGFATVALLHLERAEQDVVEHAHVREQVVTLEHHADVLAHLTPVGGLVQQLAAGESQVAAVGFFQAVEAAQQVDLPQPLGPRITTTSPWATLRSTSLSTCCSPKNLLKPWNSINALMLASSAAPARARRPTAGSR